MGNGEKRVTVKLHTTFNYHKIVPKGYGMKQETTQVVICGGSPAGLLTALWLGRAGIATLLIDKQLSPNPLPKSSWLNSRTMEILHQMGLSQAVDPYFVPVSSAPLVSFGTQLTRPLLAEVDLQSHNPADHEPTAAPAGYFPTHQLEKLWRSALTQYPSVKTYYGYEWVNLSQTAETTEIIIRPVHGGERTCLTAAYVVAADGAHSRVRELLKCATLGPKSWQHVAAIHFKADLSQWTRPECRVYWLANPQTVGKLYAVGADEWVYLASFYPPAQRAYEFTEERCIEEVRQAVGVEHLPVEFLRSEVWPVVSHTAERLSHGRVFLVGAAGHSFTYLRDEGVNTSLQDAHNLAWKLVSALHGWGQSALLTSYDSERRPVTEANSALDLEQFNELMEALGVNRQHLQTLQAQLNRPRLQQMPSDVQKLTARHTLRRLQNQVGQLEQESYQGERRQKLLAQFLAEEGVALFHPLALELGTAYRSGVLLADQSPKPAGHNPYTDYTPTTWPGGRLPQVWLHQAGQKRSSHEVLSLHKLTLLTSSPAWAEAAAAVQKNRPGVLELVYVAEQGTVQDVENEWSVLSEIGLTGAVLARPDGIVAWRSRKLPAEPTQTLTEVLDTLTNERFLKYKALPASKKREKSQVEQEVELIYRVVGGVGVIFILLWLGRWWYKRS